MTGSRHIDRIAWIAVGLAMAFCVAAMLLAPRLTGDISGGVSMDYEHKLFNTSQPITVDIRMDADQWQQMLDNARSELYYQCDAVINGTTFYGVGIRPKGNTSLSSVAMNPDTDRYSFKLEFDQFVDGQTCFGLDKLVLNNNYADATNMKEALIYDMYRYLDGSASLYNYAAIYVNGEYWGVYLALEAVEESFMLRNYGVENGALYKPDRMNMGARDRAAMPDFSASREFAASPEPTAEPDPMPPEGELSESMRQLVEQTEAQDAQSPSEEASGSFEPSFEMPGGFGPGGGGANLNYADDELDSYATIWACEVTKTTDSDHRRVVTALKHISEGTDLETYLDVDAALKYMAVHNFSVNWDSLSGGMAHNYYLHESGGKLSILPWDYNLAFGSMVGRSNADRTVNDPIDDSWSATSFFDALLDSDEYRDRYHVYYRQLIDEYIFGGGFQAFYERTRGQIDELVATDPNALYTYEEYDAAAEMLHSLVELRGESVRGQLDGTIPSTTQGQREDASALVDASEIDISVMGSMGMGGGPFGASREPSDDTDEASKDTDEADESAAEVSEDASGELSGFPGRFPFASGEMGSETDSGGLWMLAVCAAVLAAGLIFAATFRRRY